MVCLRSLFCTFAIQSAFGGLESLDSFLELQNLRRHPRVTETICILTSAPKWLICELAFEKLVSLDQYHLSHTNNER